MRLLINYHFCIKHQKKKPDQIVYYSRVKRLQVQPKGLRKQFTSIWLFCMLVFLIHNIRVKVNGTSIKYSILCWCFFFFESSRILFKQFIDCRLNTHLFDSAGSKLLPVSHKVTVNRQCYYQICLHFVRFTVLIKIPNSPSHGKIQIWNNHIELFLN